MTTITLESLAGKLTRTAEQALFVAYGDCKKRGNAHVELVHWFRELARNPNSDLPLHIPPLWHFCGGCRTGLEPNDRKVRHPTDGSTRVFVAH